MHRFRTKPPPPTLDEIKERRSRRMLFALIELLVVLVLGGMGFGLFDAVGVVSSWATPFFLLSAAFGLILGVRNLLISVSDVELQWEREQELSAVKQPAASGEKTKLPLRTTAILVLSVALSVGFFFLIPSYGRAIGRMRLTEAKPTEIEINLPEARTVFFWTDFEVSGAREEELPHLVDYEIELRRAGETLRRITCDPRDWHIASTGSSRLADASFTALIDGCTFDAPAGKLTIRARVVRRRKSSTIRILKTDLIVKLYDED